MTKTYKEILTFLWSVYTEEDNRIDYLNKETKKNQRREYGLLFQWAQMKIDWARERGKVKLLAVVSLLL